jgi:hypothetical protein
VVWVQQVFTVITKMVKERRGTKFFESGRQNLSKKA